MYPTPQMMKKCRKRHVLGTSFKCSYWAQGLEDHGWDSGFWNLGKEKGHRPEVAQNLGLYKSL